MTLLYVFDIQSISCILSNKNAFIQKVIHIDNMYCITICKLLVVFASTGSGDMIMSYNAIQAHTHWLSIATLVLMFRLLVTRWLSFM